MPRTTLSTATAAMELAAEWTRQAAATHFSLRLREDSSGAFAGLSLTAAPSSQEVATNAAASSRETSDDAEGAESQESAESAESAEGAGVRRYAETADSACKRIQSCLQPLADRSVLVRTWLDVSFEVEVLSGMVAGHLVVRQFALTGVVPDSATRAPDGTCHVSIFAHVARLEGVDEEKQHLPLKLVPEDVAHAARYKNTVLDIEFAAGQWDAHIIKTVRFSTKVSGPHQLQLCAPDGQVLWSLPLKLRGGGLTSRDASDGRDARDAHNDGNAAAAEMP